MPKNINARINLLDTSNNKNIFNLFAVISSSNCYASIKLNDDLKKEFYNELVKCLNASTQYHNLTQLIDTSKMIVKITSFSNNTILSDSLIRVLERTKDSSLIHFKELL